MIPPSQYTVTVTLVVKASDGEEAERLAHARILDELQAWFVERPHQPPYPAGILLFFNFRTRGSDHAEGEKA